MSAGVIQAIFAAYWVLKLGAPLLSLGFGLLARRQLGVSAPLWIAAAMGLHWATGLLQPAWNKRLVDRFMTDTPPMPTSVGTAVTLVSLGSDFLCYGGFLLLFAIAMAELVERTRTRVDWGGGRFVSRLVVLFPIRTQLCAVAFALAAISSVGPGIVAFLLTP